MAFKFPSKGHWLIFTEAFNLHDLLQWQVCINA